MLHAIGIEFRSGSEITVTVETPVIDRWRVRRTLYEDAAAGQRRGEKDTRISGALRHVGDGMDLHLCHMIFPPRQIPDGEQIRFLRISELPCMVAMEGVTVAAARYELAVCDFVAVVHDGQLRINLIFVAVKHML